MVKFSYSARIRKEFAHRGFIYIKSYIKGMAARKITPIQVPLTGGGANAHVKWKNNRRSIDTGGGGALGLRKHDPHRHCGKRQTARLTSKSADRRSSLSRRHLPGSRRRHWRGIAEAPASRSGDYWQHPNQSAPTDQIGGKTSTFT